MSWSCTADNKRSSMAVRHLRVPGYPRPILTLPKTIAYQGAVAGVGTRLRQCGTSGLLMGAIGWSGRPPASQQAKLARGRQSQGARHVTQTQQRSRRDRRRNRQGLVRLCLPAALFSFADLLNFGTRIFLISFLD